MITYTHLGVTRWSFLLSRSLTFHVSVSDPVSDGSGVYITWESDGPTDDGIALMSDVTEALDPRILRNLKIIISSNFS